MMKNNFRFFFYYFDFKLYKQNSNCRDVSNTSANLLNSHPVLGNVKLIRAFRSNIPPPLSVN